MAVSKGIEDAVKVEVAQLRVGQAPMRIATMALGSCLGIVLFDPEARIGALAHAMHPRRERVKNNMNRAKFVDSVIPLLVERMLQWGARRERIVAKIFGGARMFDGFTGCRGVLQIGDENVVAAREVLKEFGIPLVAECVGGRTGRTIVLDVSDGSVLVRCVNDTEEIY
ncbi:MAG: chemotaxis protein CheD [Candidatus Krumholzibacteria bacterium]|nr:chemotaxis protein CheD [Candidatus Krumholzibacteria bacterium]